MIILIVKYKNKIKRESQLCIILGRLLNIFLGSKIIKMVYIIKEMIGTYHVLFLKVSILWSNPMMIYKKRLFIPINRLIL